MQEGKRPRVAVIREELKALTGDEASALLLGQLLYWTERVRDFDQYVLEETQRARANGVEISTAPSYGWIYKTAEELSDETLLDLSKQTVLRKMKRLTDMGYLARRHNPKYAWDRTYQYRVNLLKVQSDLAGLGYRLLEYSFAVPSSTVEHPFSTLELRSSVLERRSSTLEDRSSTMEQQYQRLHPEITPEITSETTQEREGGEGGRAPQTRALAEGSEQSDRQSSDILTYDGGMRPEVSPSSLPEDEQVLDVYEDLYRRRVRAEPVGFDRQVSTRVIHKLLSAGFTYERMLRGLEAFFGPYLDATDYTRPTFSAFAKALPRLDDFTVKRQVKAQKGRYQRKTVSEAAEQILAEFEQQVRVTWGFPPVILNRDADLKRIDEIVASQGEVAVREAFRWAVSGDPYSPTEHWDHLTYRNPRFEDESPNVSAIIHMLSSILPKLVNDGILTPRDGALVKAEEYALVT